jgi:geranylgeranyl diphosphate synthase type II
MVQMSASFSEITRDLRQRIDDALDAQTRFPAGCPPRLAEAIRYSLLSEGKRLRPMLVLMAAEACGSDPEAALPAACAVEMVHTYSLIHDDLPAMDDDDLRRGRPTCHRAFDEATAILAGDALLTLAFEVLASQVQPAEVAARCCAALARAAGPTAMVGGQADDLAAENGSGSLELLESIHARKTAAMLNVSLRLGGLCAGATAEQHGVLEEYGKRLGLSFQIVDDLLDVRGSEQALGKRVGKDSPRGKLTFPGLLGADESLRRAESLVGEACAALAPLGAKAYRLEALARFVLERTR